MTWQICFACILGAFFVCLICSILWKFVGTGNISFSCRKLGYIWLKLVDEIGPFFLRLIGIVPVIFQGFNITTYRNKWRKVFRLYFISPKMFVSNELSILYKYGELNQSEEAHKIIIVSRRRGTFFQHIKPIWNLHIEHSFYIYFS